MLDSEMSYLQQEQRLGRPGGLDLLLCPLWVVEMCSAMPGRPCLATLLLLSCWSPLRGLGPGGGALLGCLVQTGPGSVASAWSLGWPLGGLCAFILSCP